MCYFGWKTFSSPQRFFGRKRPPVFVCHAASRLVVLLFYRPPLSERLSRSEDSLTHRRRAKATNNTASSPPNQITPAPTWWTSSLWLPRYCLTGTLPVCCGDLLPGLCVRVGNGSSEYLPFGSTEDHQEAVLIEMLRIYLLFLSFLSIYLLVVRHRFILTQYCVCVSVVYTFESAKILNS